MSEEAPPYEVTMEIPDLSLSTDRVKSKEFRHWKNEPTDELKNESYKAAYDATLSNPDSLHTIARGENAPQQIADEFRPGIKSMIDNSKGVQTNPDNYSKVNEKTVPPSFPKFRTGQNS